MMHNSNLMYSIYPVKVEEQEDVYKRQILGW